MTKFIFITGGVVSSLGKGIVSSSIASLLSLSNYKVIFTEYDDLRSWVPSGSFYLVDDFFKDKLSISKEENVFWIKANEDAKSFYLRAIIGSRSANTEMVIENLQSAFENDASLKDYAKKDREFIKYFENADFIALF